MTTKSTSFTIKPFKNRNGVISFRVAGWFCDQRIRQNLEKLKTSTLSEPEIVEIEKALENQHPLSAA